MFQSNNSRANTPDGRLYNTPGRKSTPRLTKSARARKKAETLRQQAAEAAKEQAAARRRKSIYNHLSHGGEFMITSGKNPFATTTGRISRKNAGDLYSFDERFRYKAATQPHNMQLCWLNLNGKSTGILLIQSKFEKEAMTLQFSLFGRLFSVELQYSEILTVGKGKDIVLEQEEQKGGELC